MGGGPHGRSASGLQRQIDQSAIFYDLSGLAVQASDITGTPADFGVIGGAAGIGIKHGQFQGYFPCAYIHRYYPIGLGVL